MLAHTFAVELPPEIRICGCWIVLVELLLVRMPKILFSMHLIYEHLSRPFSRKTDESLYFQSEGKIRAFGWVFTESY